MGDSVQYNSKQSYNLQPQTGNRRYVNNITFWKFRLIYASIQQHCSCTATDEVRVSCCRTVISESTTAVWKKLLILYRSVRYAYLKSAPKCIISTHTNQKKILGRGTAPSPDRPYPLGASNPRRLFSAARPRCLRRLDPIPPPLSQKSRIRPPGRVRSAGPPTLFFQLLCLNTLSVVIFYLL